MKATGPLLVSSRIIGPRACDSAFANWASESSCHTPLSETNEHERPVFAATTSIRLMLVPRNCTDLGPSPLPGPVNTSSRPNLLVSVTHPAATQTTHLPGVSSSMIWMPALQPVSFTQAVVNVKPLTLSSLIDLFFVRTTRRMKSMMRGCLSMSSHQ